MFLNETKPPLDEVVAHFGVLGMKWGVRKPEGESYNTQHLHDSEFEPQYKKNHTALKIAGVLLVGAAASAVVLQKNGQFKAGALYNQQLRADRNASKQEFNDALGNAYRKMKNHSFRPENVGNPLFTAHPKAAKDFVDGGFGKNGVFNVTTMKRGAKTVKDFDAQVWDVPMLAITSGRK